MTLTAHDLTTLESLDFTPVCEAKPLGPLGCGGANPADYFVRFRDDCTCAGLMCSECVARRVALGARKWRCANCAQAPTGPVPWLSIAILYPLRA